MTLFKMRATQIKIIGSAENSLDFCRIVLAKLSMSNSVLAVDVSTNQSLLASVFAGDQTRYNTKEFRHISYSLNHMDSYRMQDKYDYIIVYSDKATKEMLDCSQNDEVFLTYGVGRLSFNECCKAAEQIEKMGCSCTLVSRKSKKDRSVDYISHLINVRKTHIIPKSADDYAVLEQVDYGFNDVTNVSEPMKKVIQYISELSLVHI